MANYEIKAHFPHDVSAMTIETVLGNAARKVGGTVTVAKLARSRLKPTRTKPA